MLNSSTVIMKSIKTKMRYAPCLAKGHFGIRDLPHCAAEEARREKRRPLEGATGAGNQSM
jgi:hypothetical protein